MAKVKIVNTTTGVIQLLAAEPAGKPISFPPGVVTEVEADLLKHPTLKGYLDRGIFKRGAAAEKAANLEATAALSGNIERSNPAEVASREREAMASGEQTSVGNPGEMKDPVADAAPTYPAGKSTSARK